LTWGHLIPAYFATLSQRWIIAESPEKAREQLPESERNQELRQDTDVLDTWFSSALIPLAIAGWPDKPVDKEILSLMETGHDIVGFWVARMLILCKQ
jgi:valyl-tRNA synthetase